MKKYDNLIDKKIKNWVLRLLTFDLFLSVNKVFIDLQPHNQYVSEFRSFCFKMSRQNVILSKAQHEEILFNLDPDVLNHRYLRKKSSSASLSLMEDPSLSIESREVNSYANYAQPISDSRSRHRHLTAPHVSFMQLTISLNINDLSR